MTSSDPEKIPFIISEGFFLYSREKNNHVLLKDSVCVCVCAWVCVCLCMCEHASPHQHPSINICRPDPCFPKGPASRQFSKGKNGGGGERKGEEGTSDYLFFSSSSRLIYAALGAAQNLHTSSAQLHRTGNFRTSTGRAHSSLGYPK